MKHFGFKLTVNFLFPLLLSGLIVSVRAFSPFAGGIPSASAASRSTVVVPAVEREAPLQEETENLTDRIYFLPIAQTAARSDFVVLMGTI
jgi:hypothetical protein